MASGRFLHEPLSAYLGPLLSPAHGLMLLSPLECPPPSSPLPCASPASCGHTLLPPPPTPPPAHTLDIYIAFTGQSTFMEYSKHRCFIGF